VAGSAIPAGASYSGQVGLQESGHRKPFCASEAVQIFGGAGYMRGIKVERIYREVKVNAIGGGSEEIMKDLASRQMGL
jgi:alkylation response protein AidB-like acyl-CoA dehydrogenase